MSDDNGFRWLSGVDRVSAKDWDRLVEPHGLPFYHRDWLVALEQNDCATPRKGWHPSHLTLWDEGRLVGLAPLYIKEHSRGEFVFDQEWAELSHRFGVPYYPKMLGMSPFTPARGYRFFLDPQLDEVATSKAFLQEIETTCRANQIQSCHFLHTAPDWHEVMTPLGAHAWLHHALVWENHQFSDFEDYLKQFKSKRRNKIRRERSCVVEEGLVFETIPGNQAPQAYFSWIYDFYAITCEKFWNWSHYLSREFFQAIGETMADKILFVVAKEDGGSDIPVAMSMQIIGGETLYGRYWGCREHYDQLHFETCYYQPVEWGISNGFRYFDAGSGNATHKRRRGFPATPNYSLHLHFHPLMDQLFEKTMPQINRLEREQIDAINQ